MEKVKYLSLTGAEMENPQRELEINIITDKEAGTITVQDSGIGMDRQEAINNLGTIARSGYSFILISHKKMVHIDSLSRLESVR